ncbi:hypothetical protein BLNAU_15543 [Blattamonas nauphoetae]|uniref:Uncharacterized protein n=1 Tax=Blattamonas nauphoetae TaxID=2049346 RepID=A0ABQ9XCA1_9EUKA|nr:hypothetical protein BLNAU_15543 [Blattamonas nauphoetae]
MLFENKTLTVQARSGLEQSIQFLRTNSGVLSVRYSKGVSGSPLPIDAGIMSSLCTAFSKSASATQLTLSHIPLRPSVLKEMTPLFSPSSKLRTLILSDCDMDEEAFIILFTMILRSAHSKLQYLDISRNKLGEFKVQKHAQFDATPATKLLSRLLVDRRILLSSVNLGNNPLGNFGVHCISQVLPHSSLRELSLNSVHLTPKGALCLFRILRHAPSLTKLVLSENIIGHDSLVFLFRELPSTRLVALDLRNTHLDDAALLHLGQVLKSPSLTLEDIDISSNELHKPAVQSFSNCLKQNKSLRRITCYDCSINSLYPFIRTARRCQIEKDGLPPIEIKPLLTEEVTSITPIKYWTVNNVVVFGALYTILLTALDVFDNVNDLVAGIQLMQDGLYLYGILTFSFLLLSWIAGFVYYWTASSKKKNKRRLVSLLYLISVGQIWDTAVLLWRGRGNWDELEVENTDDLVSMDTFEILGMLRTITEAIPLIVMDSYLILVTHEEVNASVIIQFVIQVLSFGWSIAEHLVDVDIDKDIPMSLQVRSSFMWRLRIAIYLIVSLVVLVFQLSMVLAYSLGHFFLTLGAGLIYYLAFSFAIVRPQKKGLLSTLYMGIQLVPMFYLSYSDQILCTTKGRSKYFTRYYSINRSAFIVADLLSCVWKLVLLFLYLLPQQAYLPVGIPFFAYLMAFLDVMLIFLRIVTETNGVSSSLN